MPDLLDLVNPLCGSDSEREFSTGLTYPAVGVPWGMTYFSPRNRDGGQVFSRRRSWPVNVLQGFTATHAPSPWMGEYCSFTVLPGVGTVPDFAAARYNSYRLDEETSRPDLYRVRLTSPDILCELTATARCGLMRLTYPPADDANLTLQLASPQCEAEQVGDREIEITARDGRGLIDGFAGRHVLRLDRPIAGVRRIAGDGGAGDALVLKFSTADNRPVRLELATSFVGHDQARLNARRELGGRDFDAVRAATAEAWSSELGRVRVTGGTTDQRRTFYTCLWRALLFPHTLTEPDDAGREVHFSPYTARVEPGPLVTDNGFWDTSRTVYPLLSLVWRRKLGELLDGFLTAYRQSGWMPQWASPGHRACMVGTHSAAVFCDAITKNIGGFDHETAFASMVKDATEPGDPEGRYGRQQLPEYVELGYCPDEGDIDSVCRTLDYSYNDWCCARVAEALGEAGQAETFGRRAGNWRNVFDPDVSFFRPRRSGGDWAGPFREFAWGGPYREGGPWQYRFSVPHDPAGLAEAMGGPDELAANVRAMVDTPPRYEPNVYGRQIHEMLEHAAGHMGQYAHSNQPVHGALWTAARVGRPNVTDALVRRVLDELYTPEAFPGDEDNGEMGAWYVLAAIGLFPHCPGDPSYTTTPPLFESIELHGDDGQIIRLDGRQPPDRRVRHADLLGS